MTKLPRAGDIFNERYELLESLGAGGLGTVFSATQLDCNRKIALKILHQEVNDDDELRKRFLREARTLSQVQHDGVVAIYHLGISEEGFAYIAMELIRGRSLRKLLIDNGTLPVYRAIKIFRKIATALAAVHKEKVVHRDLKPENIVMLDKPEPDTIKLIDFGLARIEGGEKLTKSGTIMGTTAYMSPEQCRGKPADLRSDIYSLTICFYEVITGNQPFQADNTVAVLMLQINEPAPKIYKNNVDRYHPALNDFVAKGMAKLADERFQTMDEFIAALDKLEEKLIKEGVDVAPLSAEVAVPKAKAAKDLKAIFAMSFLALVAVSMVAAEIWKINAKTAATLNPVVIKDTDDLAFSRIRRLVNEQNYREAASELAKVVGNYDKSHHTGTSAVAADPYLVDNIMRVWVQASDLDAIKGHEDLSYVHFLNEISAIFLNHVWHHGELSLAKAKETEKMLKEKTPSPALDEEIARTEKLMLKLEEIRAGYKKRAEELEKRSKVLEDNPALLELKNGPQE